MRKNNKVRGLEICEKERSWRKCKFKTKKESAMSFK